jgi:hypothetical protein
MNVCNIYVLFEFSYYVRTYANICVCTCISIQSPGKYTGRYSFSILVHAMLRTDSLKSTGHFGLNVLGVSEDQ